MTDVKRTDERRSESWKRRRHGALSFVALVALGAGGCARTGAPSFSLVGAYFPAWMLCGLAGIAAALVARLVFVASGLAAVVPYQLAVCVSIGAFVAMLVWTIWFGR
jgi:hypothetical protein